MSDYLTRTNNGTSFSGSDMNIYHALVLASGLKLYKATKMKPTRAYTPTAMLRMATHFTGNKYKRGEYLKAAADLTAYADILKGLPKQEK
jgi:hypothetical protein